MLPLSYTFSSKYVECHTPPFIGYRNISYRRESFGTSFYSRDRASSRRSLGRDYTRVCASSDLPSSRTKVFPRILEELKQQ